VQIYAKTHKNAGRMQPEPAQEHRKEAENSQKLYYTIKEVADELGINTSKLRYYEQEFDDLKPKRTKDGDRLYTTNDITLVRDIIDLTTNRGLKLAAAKVELKKRVTRQRETARLIADLQAIRAFLVQVRAELG
jgi:DNA-binding transcriptional MerR regulator